MEQLQTLLNRQRAIPNVRPTQENYEEWQAAVHSFLGDCLSFYDTHADSSLRWDAIASAQFIAQYYHKVRRGIAYGGSKWFPKGTELVRRTPRVPRDPAAPFACSQDEFLDSEEQVRTAMMMDAVLSSAEWARVLVIADWAIESEPADVEPGVYAALAHVRAMRQHKMDLPSTNDMVIRKIPDDAFAGRRIQAERWLRNIEKRFPGESIRTATSRHAGWSVASAHEHCADAYFSNLVRTVPESEFVAELRRYRRGPSLGVAASACEQLKSWKRDALKQKDGTPLVASDLGLTMGGADSPEAIYLEFVNTERVIRAAADAQALPANSPTSSLKPERRRPRYIDSMERSLFVVGRLGEHRLRLRVIAHGFTFAVAFIEDLTKCKEDHDYLRSATLQRIVELARSALMADDLDPGVHASILEGLLKMLYFKLSDLSKEERAGSTLARDVAAEMQPLYRGFVQRWPTLFEFKDEGDRSDWYADLTLGEATKLYLSVLSQGGLEQELRSEAARIIAEPHPCAAHSAAAMLAWRDAQQAKAA